VIHVSNIIFSQRTELSSLTLYDHTFVIHVPNIIFSQRTELSSLTLYDHTFVIHVSNIIFSQRTELSSLTLYDHTFVIHVSNIIFSENRVIFSYLIKPENRARLQLSSPVQGTRYKMTVIVPCTKHIIWLINHSSLQFKVSCWKVELYNALALSFFNKKGVSEWLLFNTNWIQQFFSYIMARTS